MPHPETHEAWVGRERIVRGRIDLDRARKLAATLDRDPDDCAPGDPLPLGWHWIYLTPAARSSDLGDDGHPRRGEFLPPVARARRMWAGGHVRFLAPLRIGVQATRTSTVRAIETKEGRSGPLTFVTVRHVLRDPGGVVVEEDQELVYLDGSAPTQGGRPGGETGPRDEGEPADPGPADESGRSGDDATGDSEHLDTFTTDEVALFRFSALTFNAHRIHYDLRYATESEGYPGVIVHGPLLALLLLGAGARRLDLAPDPSGPVAFRYRAVRPAFCGEVIELHGGGVADGALHLQARVRDRAVVMTATLGGEMPGRSPDVRSVVEGSS